MFKTSSYNTNTGSFMNESAYAVSSCARLVMDTVIAVSIFVLLGIIIALAEVSVIILSVLNVIIAVLLSVIIIDSNILKRPVPVKAP